MHTTRVEKTHTQKTLCNSCSSPNDLAEGAVFRRGNIASIPWWKIWRCEKRVVHTTRKKRKKETVRNHLFMKLAQFQREFLTLVFCSRMCAQVLHFFCLYFLENGCAMHRFAKFDFFFQFILK